MLPLQNANPPIISHDRLQSFIAEVFHNYRELLQVHRQLLDRLFGIQREEHPLIRTVTEPLLNAALSFRDAYMKYMTNIPLSHLRIDGESSNSLAFQHFAEVRRLLGCGFF